MNFEIFDLNEKAKWEDALKQLPITQQDVYYTPNYYALYQEKNDGQARCFVYTKEGKTAIYPFLMNSVKRLNLIESATEYHDIQGAYGYNGIIASHHDKSFLDGFFTLFVQFCRDFHVIAEFTRFHPLLNNYLLGSGHLAYCYDRKTVTLDLNEGYSALWKNSFSPANRNKIRKARKNELRVELVENENGSGDIFRLYTQTMNDVGADAYYYFPLFYFQRIREKLDKNHFQVNVYYKEHLTASVIVLHYGLYAHYHLTGRERRYAHLSGNNLALDTAIRHAIDLGCQRFHLGGGNTSMARDPLLIFKSSFSNTQTNFYTGTKIHEKDIYRRVCENWERRYPEKIETFGSRTLKYRY